MDEQYNYEECCRCCKGCLVQRIDEQTKYGEHQVGTGTIVDGVHALATGLLIASISSYAVRSGQRACECRIRSEQGQDYITNTADDVGTVRVELDVLVVASCLETKLLNGYEVAVCDNPCNDCVRQSSDPNAGITSKADEQRRNNCEQAHEVRNLDDFARPLEVELASNAACDEQCDNSPKEAVVAEDSNELVGIHVLTYALGEHKHEYNYQAAEAANGNGIDSAAGLQANSYGVNASAHYDTSLDGGRYHSVELLR